MKISRATFVSLLFPTQIIQRIGLPYEEMFIWGDDTEYTRRATRIAPAYLVGASVTTYAARATKINLLTERDKNKDKYYYYHYRNSVFNCRKYDGNIELVLLMVKFFGDFLRLAVRFEIIYDRAKGAISGFLFQPVRRGCAETQH